MVNRGPINDPEGIMDGGWYIHKGKLTTEKKHFEWLLKSNFKFIMGFDNMPTKDREKYINLMIDNNKPVYPIIKSTKDWNWFIKNGWLDKVEGVSIASVAPDEIFCLAHKQGLNIHHLGRIRNKELFKYITSIDLNPYETTKQLLLDLGSDYIIKLPNEILELGEFILYGSAVYVDKPNDIDLLYYGKLDEKDVKQRIADLGFKDVNVLGYTKDKHKTGKITHLLFAMDNGIKLTPCPTLEKMYKEYKGLTLKQFYYKMYLCSNYHKDNFFDKELKTLLVTYQYYCNNKLSNFLWNRLHIIYKIVGDKDKKAEMLFNRQLFSRFKRIMVLPLNNRMDMYERKKVEHLIDLFFPVVDKLIDPEKIMINITDFDLIVKQQNLKNDKKVAEKLKKYRSSLCDKNGIIP